MKKSVKGQGAVIITVLLILIIITAVVIVFSFVIPLVKDSAGEIEGSANLFKTGFTIEKATFYVTGGAKVLVKGGEISKDAEELRFIFKNEDGTTKVISRTENLPKQIETLPFDFDASEVNGKIVEIGLVPIVNGKTGIEETKKVDTNSNLGNADNNVIDENSGLVSWWKFDGDFTDSFGGNDGAANGGASIDNDVERGNILLLEGGGENVEVDDDDSLDFTDLSFTISVWVNTVYNVTFWHNIMDKDSGDCTAGTRGWILLFKDGLPGISTQNCGVLFGTSIVDGEWHHIVIQSDTTDTTDFRRLYVDGSFIGEQGTFNVKNDEKKLSFAPGGSFKGSLDDIMIFDKALSGDEVTALFNNQKK